MRDLIDRAGDEARDEIEILVNGGVIEKPVYEDITYEDIYLSEDNLWNFLFFTGYLKQVKQYMVEEERYASFAIPNREVRSIYKRTISNWFRDGIRQQNLTGLYEGLLKGDVARLQEELGMQLQGTISYMDSKEAFYHGFLLGVLGQLEGYRVKSNQESGLGRYDICVCSLNVRKPVILLELKLAESYRLLDRACDEALTQMEEKHYIGDFEKDGYTEWICYGIGFYKKQVRVKVNRKRI